MKKYETGQEAPRSATYHFVEYAQLGDDDILPTEEAQVISLEKGNIFPLIESTGKHAYWQDPFEDVTKECETAEEFLDKLSKRSPLWSGRAVEWVYRGQNDAKWELIPSLFREKHFIENPDYEHDLINNFRENANFFGLEIPNGISNHRSIDTLMFLVATQDNNIHGFSNLSNPIFGFVQHYGLPTRLLDFTYESFNAAYFAADFTNFRKIRKLDNDTKALFFSLILKILDRDTESKDIENIALLEETQNITDIKTLEDTLDRYFDIRSTLNAEYPTPGFICVWAINKVAINKTNIRLLTYPFNSFTYLRQQDGCFLFNKEHSSNTSFCKELLKLVPSKDIYKLTLPVKNVGELQRLLGQEKIHKTALMPDYRSIAQSVIRMVERHYSKIKGMNSK